jgi:hypothetical protein
MLRRSVRQKEKKMMKPIAIAILLSSLASAVYATQQVPEVLLEKPSSTACWRGYVGTWKIENDELYLVALQEGHPRTGAIPLNKVNPDWISPVKATWFTGTIQIGKGGGRGKVVTGTLEIKNGKVVPSRQADNTKRQKEAEPESGHVRK